MTVRPFLIADIGGTNARFAISSKPGAVTEVVTYRAVDHPNLEDVVLNYLQRLDAHQKPHQGVIAVACPVLERRIAFTNSAWEADIDQLEKSAGLDRLDVINDFEAVAWALPKLKPDRDYRSCGGANTADRGPLCALGPGTGLGVGGLIPVGLDGWHAITGEGGHVTMAARTDREADILKILRDQTNDHISAEKVLSGFGLVNIYRALSALSGDGCKIDDPAQVTKAANGGDDPIASEAITQFSAFLGTVASDLALTFGARGGVYIGGGVVPAMAEVFDQGAFRSRFEDKGRFRKYLQNIPTRLIIHPNPGLLGLSLRPVMPPASSSH